ncbi:MAG: amidohydrolase family protein [Candidatus Hydrothermarchaeota archaeon]
MILKNLLIFYSEDLIPISGYLKIKGDEITEIGEGYNFYGIDMKGRWMLPSFINTHTHLGDSCLVEQCYSLSLEDCVGPKGLKHKLLGKKSNEDIINGIKSSLDIMLACGTLAFCDFREGGKNGIILLKEALKHYPIKGIILGRPNGDYDAIEYADGWGISSVRDYNERELEEMSNRRGKKLLGIHACEIYSDELLECMKYEPDFLVHLTKASEYEVDYAIKKEVPIVICPRSNLYFRLGIPSASILNSKYICLGTDNAMANTPDILEEMRFSFRLYSNISRDTIDPKIFLKAITVNPSEVLKLDFGIIEEGKRANLVIINPEKELKWAKDPLLAFVSRGRSEHVHQVVKDGKILIWK